MTVAELVASPDLRTRFLAGRCGGQRAVLWAHTCELEDPWNWLGTGDLLLSDGLNFPAGPDEQVHFIRSLDRSALSGLALAEGMHAPALSDEAVDAADALSFPVLETAYALPFVTVARAVADRNTQESGARIRKIIRIYDVLRQAHQASFRGGPLLDDLARETGTQLHVVDPITAEPLAPDTERLAQPAREAVTAALSAARRPMPTFVRVTGADVDMLALPLGTGERGVLLAASTPRGAPVDLVVLQHLATVAHLEVERRSALSLRRTQAGARLLEQLVDGSVDFETAEAGLAAMGMRHRPWRVLSVQGANPFRLDELQSRLWAADLPHLASCRDDHLLALLPEAYANRDIISFDRGSPLVAGLSQPVHQLRGVGDAVRQARWAMEAARSDGQGFVVYGEQSPAFMPKTVEEGRAVIARVLGPIEEYDEQHGSQLLTSLRVFFDCNRSWKLAADRLGVHRQTLTYRIRRVEELTGRDLRSLPDQTDLYLAMRTQQMLDTGAAASGQAGS